MTIDAFYEMIRDLDSTMWTVMALARMEKCSLWDLDPFMLTVFWTRATSTIWRMKRLMILADELYITPPSEMLPQEELSKVTIMKS